MELSLPLFALALSFVPACGGGAASLTADTPSVEAADDDATTPDPGAPDDPGAPADTGASSDLFALSDPGKPVDPGTPNDPGKDVPAPTDPGAPCDNPFVPTGATVKWEHLSTSTFVITQGAANHRGQDVVVNPGQDAVLIGKFAYGAFDKDLKDELVETWFQRNPPCGGWEKLGSDATSEEGEFGTQLGVEDDGGMVFRTLPAAQVPGPGVYPVVMLVKGDHSTARFDLYVWKPGRKVVVTDIDGTMTTGDSEVFSEYFSKLFEGSYVPKMYDDADTVMRLYADKGYDIVYMTGRPNWLKGITSDWLVAKGFPRGPVHVTNESSEVLPTKAGVQAYKTAFLAFLAGGRGADLRYAYGNATTDIGAYAAAKIGKERTFIIGKNAGADGTQAIQSYTAHLPVAGAMPAAQQP